MGIRKPKRHCPDPETIDFDKEMLLEEVESMPRDKQ